MGWIQTPDRALAALLVASTGAGWRLEAPTDILMTHLDLYCNGIREYA